MCVAIISHSDILQPLYLLTYLYRYLQINSLVGGEVERGQSYGYLHMFYNSHITRAGGSNKSTISEYSP